MRNKTDLVGKTIEGLVAVPLEEGGPMKIWMRKFTDGTHVEFVSPGARRTLDRIAQSEEKRARKSLSSPQLALDVAC